MFKQQKKYYLIQQNIERAVNNEANLRKWYNIVKYEKKTQTRTKMDKLKNNVTFFLEI